MHHTTQFILKFLKFYKSTHDGCSPTYRQISQGCDLASTSVVAYHLDKLKDAGLIERPADSNDIMVVGGQWSMMDENRVSKDTAQLLATDQGPSQPHSQRTSQEPRSLL